MKIIPVITILIILLGCNADRRAYYQYSCPIGEPPQHIIDFNAPTGEWSMGHSFLYRETHRNFAFTLPAKPLPNTKINHFEIQFFERDGLKQIPIVLTDGYIALQKQELFLNLQTQEGPFWANGGYVFSKPLQIGSKEVSD